MTRRRQFPCPGRGAQACTRDQFGHSHATVLIDGGVTLATIRWMDGYRRLSVSLTVHGRAWHSGLVTALDVQKRAGTPVSGGLDGEVKVRMLSD
jgi:hypothetical protein